MIPTTTMTNLIQKNFNPTYFKQNENSNEYYKIENCNTNYH